MEEVRERFRSRVMCDRVLKVCEESRGVGEVDAGGGSVDMEQP